MKLICWKLLDEFLNVFLVCAILADFICTVMITFYHFIAIGQMHQVFAISELVKKEHQLIDMLENSQS